MTDTNVTDHAEQPKIRLGAWNEYFIAKFLLFARSLIGFHALENLAFAVFLLLPIKSASWRRARLIIAIPLAIALLYYDSWLPAIGRVISETSNISHFSAAYMLELVGRFISGPVVALLVIGLTIAYLADRYIRVGFLVLVTLVVLSVTGIHRQQEQMPLEASVQDNAEAATTSSNSGTAATDLSSLLQQFYAKESQRVVKFPAASGTTPFDIIIIQICSLSWDDLQAVGLDTHPLWSNFDFIFKHFNSAASYSGPAAIRLNRAPCGQTSHQALYSPVSDQCLLMPSLQQSGFATNFAMNHDGHFDNFLTLVRQQGISAPLTSFDGLTAPLHAFDSSPVYDDLDVLSRWFSTRQKATDSQVALFYNTITLHDGNRFTSGKSSGSDNYKPRAEKLFSELGTFMDQIQKSGRRALVVVVPEHGAALRGDKFQISGLREIATPAITTVPVGIKLIGPDINHQGGAAQIDAQVSYLGLSQLIANLIDHPPFGKADFSASDYVADLPTTTYVSENESATIIERNQQYFLKLGTQAWQEYTTNRN